MGLIKKPKEKINGIDILDFLPGSGTDINELVDIVINQHKHIRHLFLKKRSGKVRKIVAPSDRYAGILRSLLFNFFKYYRASDQANGFVLGKSIVSNAQPHIGCKTIINLDLKNFFDNMTFNMANKALMGNRAICQHCSNRFEHATGKCHPTSSDNRCGQFVLYEKSKGGIPTKEEDLLSYRNNALMWVLLLCTVHDKKRNIRYTPQGFPTSPALSNFIMGTWFDKLLNKFCIDHDPILTYSRYADDLTLSCKEHLDKDAVKGIITKVYKYVSAWKRDPNNKTNLLVNEDKTEVHRGVARKEVCGIVVNENMSIRRHKIMEFRAKLHNILVGKLVDGVRVRTTASGKEVPAIVGLANYYNMVNPKYRTYLDQARKIQEMVRSEHV